MCKGVPHWALLKESRLQVTNFRSLLTYTTNAYQLTRLRTAERPTGLIFTNGWSSLIYMNGCELSTFECCIHHAFGEESMAAPSTYGAVQGL